ncbi:MFS transporter [Jatrophihabitans sp. YIM 134969]
MARSGSGSGDDAPVTLRKIAPSVFLPALVYEIGDGAIAPIIALTALDVGASPGTAGFMLALLGIGQILGDIPAGRVADRIGDRHAMAVASSLAALGLLGCFFTGSLWLLGLCLLLVGASNSTYYLARQSYLTEVAPLHLRARALSTLGGSHRIGLFIGPFLGAAAISVGGLRSAYLVAIAAVLASGTLVLVIKDVPSSPEAQRAVRGAMSSSQMFVRYRRLFVTLGLAVFAVGAVRAARQTVLPLWAEHIGLSASTTSIVFGIASAVDMALFYPSGKVMDQFGRLAVALPSMIVLGGAMVALPLTHGVVTLTIVAMTMSFGNGIGSGIMMTLGADVAPADGRTRFLAVWRLYNDSGNAVGPVVVSLVALASTLATGIVAIGSVGLLAAAALGRWVPRYSPFATRASTLAHRRAQAESDAAG